MILGNMHAKIAKFFKVPEINASKECARCVSSQIHASLFVREKHRSTLIVRRIPSSLMEALDSFISQMLAKHQALMKNVRSRFSIFQAKKRSIFSNARKYLFMKTHSDKTTFRRNAVSATPPQVRTPEF